MQNRTQLFTILSTAMITLGAVVVMYTAWQHRTQSLTTSNYDPAVIDGYQNQLNCVETLLSTGVLKIDHMPEQERLQTVPTASEAAALSSEASVSADQR